MLLTSAVFLVTTYVIGRNSVLSDVVAQAAIVADNSNAALAFGDQNAATDTLRALRAKANIDLACLYDLNGEIFTYFATTPT